MIMRAPADDFITQAYAKLGKELEGLTNAVYFHSESQDEFNKEILSTLVCNIDEIFAKIDQHLSEIELKIPREALLEMETERMNLMETFIFLRQECDAFLIEEQGFSDGISEFESKTGVDGGSLLTEMNALLSNLHVATGSDYFDSLEDKRQFMEESLKIVQALFQEIQRESTKSAVSPSLDLIGTSSAIVPSITSYERELLNLSKKIEELKDRSVQRMPCGLRC